MTQEFGNLLRKIREQESITQKALAKEAGIHHNTINRVEAGEYLMGPEVAIAVATTLNIPVENQTKFFLLAAGYPEELVNKLLNIDQEILENIIFLSFKTP